VNADTRLEKSGYVEAMGRIGGQYLNNPAAVNAYHLRVGDNGAWSVSASPAALSSPRSTAR